MTSFVVAVTLPLITTVFPIIFRKGKSKGVPVLSMNAYLRVEIRLHSLLKSALDGSCDQLHWQKLPAWVDERIDAQNNKYGTSQSWVVYHMLAADSHSCTRSAFLGEFTQWITAVPYRRFGTTYQTPSSIKQALFLLGLLEL
jgi:hypothetical protein